MGHNVSWSGGHWPRKGVWGCAALKTPYSRLSCSSQGSHFKQKSQFTRPPFEKIWKFNLYSLNFHPNFSSQAPKFGNFQLTSPQIWKISAHKSPFSEANVSSQPPHFGIRAAHPYLKKISVPPPPRVLVWDGSPLASHKARRYASRLMERLMTYHPIYQDTLGRMRTPVREAFSYGIRHGILHFHCDSMKLKVILHWITMNMPYAVQYPVWKCLPYGSTHPPYYIS